jgi:hypothetical protein
MVGYSRRDHLKSSFCNSSKAIASSHLMQDNTGLTSLVGKDLTFSDFFTTSVIGKNCSKIKFF